MLNLKTHINFKIILLIAVIITINGCGSDDEGPSSLSSSDPSKAYVSQSGAVTVSGTVIDAIKRSLISGASVSMRVDGNTFTVDSSSASSVNPGSFAFLNVPAESEYFISVSSPTDAGYAPYFYANETPRISNNSGGIGTQDVGLVELYTAVNTSITVKNIGGGAPVTGLTLYYDTKDIAEENSGASVAISGVDVVATEASNEVDLDMDGVNETVGTGVYTFALPSNASEFNIKVEDLVDDANVEYDPYNATITDSVLTNLVAGSDKSYYVKPADPAEFTIFIHLVDENGDAFDAGDVIVLNETGGSNDPIFAERSATVNNEYVLITTAANFDFTILNMDLNLDGVNDTATAQLTTLDETTNVLDGGSFDTNREATVVVPINMIVANQNIAAELLSDSDKFQVNGIAEVIIAFDRPVEIIHDMRMRIFSENAVTTLKAVENPAALLQSDLLTTANLVGGGANNVSLNAGDNTLYDYLNDSSVAQTIAIPGADSNGDVVSPYEVTYDTVESVSVVPASSYSFSASDTLLTITLDATTLAANKTYTFEFAVRGLLTDTPVAYINQSMLAKSNVTISSVADLWLDDLNYIDTVSKDVTGVTPDVDLTGQGLAHISRYVTLANATYDGSNNPQAEFLTYNLLSTGTFDSMPAAIYLVSPAQLSGSVQVVSQTETYDNASTAATDVVTNIGTYYGLDYSSNSGIVAGDADLQNLIVSNNITSDAKYLLAVPSNHGVNETGIKATYGDVLEDTANEVSNVTTVVTSGADITTEGIYYLYAIPLNTSMGGFISSAVLDFNINVNGVNITGSQSFPVQ